jgi:hypothetical protein
VYREVTVADGTMLSIELQTAAASDTSRVEDMVTGVLRKAVIVDGVEVLPSGAVVKGNVVAAEPSGKVKGRARLALRFTSITVDGEPMRITTATIARVAAATKKEDATKVGIGAGAGAVIGAIAGGGKGAAIGGAIGAGAGTGVVLATKGDEVRLTSGTPLAATLSSPLVVRVRVK